MRDGIDGPIYSEGCKLAHTYVDYWWSPEHKYEWEDNLNEYREELNQEEWDSFFSVPVNGKSGLQTFIELVEGTELQDREFPMDVEDPNTGTFISSAQAQAIETFDRHVIVSLVASEEISAEEGKRFKEIVEKPEFLQGFAETMLSRFKDALGDFP